MSPAVAGDAAPAVVASAFRRDRRGEVLAIPVGLDVAAADDRDDRAVAFHAAEIGLDPRHGPLVAIVSGGNVEPDRYREYLAAPIPSEG